MVDAVLEEARRQFAPDRRTAVCELHAELVGGQIVLRGEVHDERLRGQVLAFLTQRTGLPVRDELRSLPDPSLGESYRGVIRVSVANLHREPELGATVITQALLGTPVQIMKRRGDWLYVQLPDSYLGWINETVVVMDRQQYCEWTAREKLIVTAFTAACQQSADPDSAVVSDLVAGDILALGADAGDLYELAYPDGRVGFLPRTQGQPLRQWLASCQATPEAIVATARRFMGIPYLWGAASTKAVDCSGLVRMAFFLNGLLLPRDADQQAQTGAVVPLEEAAPGDLFFFATPAPGGEKRTVTHVGISLGGRRYIEASGDVRLSSLDPTDRDYRERRAATFIGVRRVLGAGNGTGVRRLQDIAYYHGECEAVGTEGRVA